MLLRLILIISIFPIVELAVLIKLAQTINWVNTILIVIITGLLGALIAKHQGLSVLQKIQSELSQGNLPTDNIIDGFLVFIGGVFLIAPGLITDIIGLFIIIPYTRHIIRYFLKRKFKKKLNITNSTNFNIIIK